MTKPLKRNTWHSFTGRWVLPTKTFGEYIWILLLSRYNITSTWIVRLNWALKKAQMEEHGRTMGKNNESLLSEFDTERKNFCLYKVKHAFLPFLLVILSWLQEPPHNGGKATKTEWKGWSCHGTNWGVLFFERAGCDILHDHLPCLRFPDMQLQAAATRSGRPIISRIGATRTRKESYWSLQTPHASSGWKICSFRMVSKIRISPDLLFLKTATLFSKLPTCIFLEIQIFSWYSW